LGILILENLFDNFELCDLGDCFFFLHLVENIQQNNIDLNVVCDELWLWTDNGNHCDYKGIEGKESIADAWSQYI